MASRLNRMRGRAQGDEGLISPSEAADRNPGEIGPDAGFGVRDHRLGQVRELDPAKGDALVRFAIDRFAVPTPNFVEEPDARSFVSVLDVHGMGAAHLRRADGHTDFFVRYDDSNDGH